MLRFLKYTALIAVVVGATAATTMAFMNMSQASNVDKSPAITQVDPIFSEFQPFTVTLYGENRNRILYTSITLRLADTDSLEQINKYMPEARDRILKTLSSLDQKKVQTAQDRENLAKQIKNSLARPYDADLDSPNIVDVLFTAFVVQ